MRQKTNVPDGHWHTCQYAKSLSVFSHFKCYPLPSPVQRNSSDLGDSHKWPWSGWGGPDPWTPPPSAAPVVFVVYQCVLDWVSFPWSHCNTYVIFPHCSCNSLWCQFIFFILFYFHNHNQWAFDWRILLSIFLLLHRFQVKLTFHFSERPFRSRSRSSSSL